MDFKELRLLARRKGYQLSTAGGAALLLLDRNKQPARSPRLYNLRGTEFSAAEAELFLKDRPDKERFGI